MPVDRFYDYLDYVEDRGPIGPGDYLDLLGVRETLAWTRLVIDLRDTYAAGMLRKVRCENGSVAYVRKHTQRKGKLV